jgi:DMSO reductase anchor subunit
MGVRRAVDMEVVGEWIVFGTAVGTLKRHASHGYQSSQALARISFKSPLSRENVVITLYIAEFKSGWRRWIVRKMQPDCFRFQNNDRLPDS